MQFQFNADYPGVQPDGTFLPVDPKDPKEFPAAQPIPCARITTRIYHPSRNQVATVENVLVRTLVRTLSRTPVQREDSDSSLSSNGMSSSSDESMMEDADPTPPSGGPATIPIEEERAYWLQRTIREAIYGRVLFAIVLRRRMPTLSSNDNAEWEVTDQQCAVKEMSWQHIRKERARLAEDPIKEVSAMLHLKKWYMTAKKRQGQVNVSDTVSESFQAILETNTMMPLDLLSDDRHLYSVMPYCDGGELFERLDMNERFTEEEARYWMVQVLNGLENLQKCGICHRDMSLENLLVHQSGALIIDMGMCLGVPTIDITTIGGSKNANGDVDGRRLPRYLIRPQGTCGKWIYMSPEIYKNREPFDGFTVDMWAAGVILFLMVTGFPPWERACKTDERFKYMTAGYLVQMLTEWDVPISSDAMDLLQRMLFVDPKDRLSLDQVRAHPWMVNGRMQPPTDIDGH